jgi:hypothetical protein
MAGRGCHSVDIVRLRAKAKNSLVSCTVLCKNETNSVALYPQANYTG